MQATLTLRNQAGELSRLHDWLAQLAKAASYSERDSFRIELVLNEVFANIIDHAFPRGGAPEIGLRLEHTPQVTTVTITDDGPPFDPLTVPEKVLPERLEEAEPGGLGIHLIRSYCDECRYQRTGGRNSLCLVFHHARPEPHTGAAAHTPPGMA